ncbi:methyltransferase domain-containing protein [Halomonas alkalicola]|uniref:methyltransferase domain-containing protein n=1 Tax=Halomonas alkalicola TaxID=1930622 RepID=UPI00265DBEB4|nr:methyltransferase domain-containing protein [Halomonas alkalicola]
MSQPSHTRPTGPAVSPLSAHGDRHFDGLAEKFAASLYGGVRGELRLALLDQLLPEMLALHDQPMLDVGGGLGQLAGWFAERGHAVTLAEPAAEMLARARESLSGQPVTFIQAPLQTLPDVAPGPWSLIACHAVLEWLGDPRAALATLAGLLAPGGQLSLMVFNRDALRFSNVVKGNLEKALADRLEGKGERLRLTPISPLTHAQVEAWSAECGLAIRGVAGIRIFNDYLRQPPQSDADREALLALERRYCRVDPHWRLGRYLLYTLVRPDSPTPLAEEPGT